MFEIYNARKQFWQWDTGQRLIVQTGTCSEVHFCNGTSDCSLVVEVYEENGLCLANVPNILLQTAKAIKVFAYVCDGEDRHTERAAVFPVFQRTKPDDYVYTETEVLSYQSLEKRVSDLEKGGGSGGVDWGEVEKLVDEALAEAKENGDFDGEPGDTPYIKEGYWWIGETDTGVKAQGEPGKPGVTPHIGANGNWFVGDTDTGVPAKGDDYVLTTQDKSDIAQMTVDLLPKYNGEVEDV